MNVHDEESGAPAFCVWAPRYLDSAVERRPVLLLEAGPDVQHVHLAPRHHDPHQGAVVGAGALCTEERFRREDVCRTQRCEVLRPTLMDLYRRPAK